MFCLCWLLSGAAFAQQKPAEADSSKPKPTTLDAWRQALPQGEAAPAAPAAGDTAAASDDGRTKETTADIERKLSALEGKLMEAVKTKNGVVLQQLLADDFQMTGSEMPRAALGKIQTIQSVTRDWQIAAYDLKKTLIRVYGEIAVVSAWYEQQAAIKGRPMNGVFLVTDVWLKRGEEAEWRVVSRSLSRAADAAQ